MIRHAIKLIWNRKRSLAWIFAEQALVFAVMLLIFTSQVDRVIQYYAKGAMRMDDVALVAYMEYDRPGDPDEESGAQFRGMIERMRQWPTVDLITVNRANAMPGTGSISNDSVSFNERRFRANVRFCDENYYRIFAPKLTEGEWFRDAESYEEPPALVTELLAERMEMTGSAVGQSVYYNGATYRIIGVVEAFKERASYEQLATIFLPYSMNTELGFEYAVKFKPGRGSDFAKAFIAEFNSIFPSDRYMPVFLDFNKAMVQMNFFEYSFQLYMTGLPVAFLFVFAFLGTFGLVWVQSKKRMTEFGLRMAMGCTPGRLIRAIVFENLFLTVFAMLPSLVVAAHLYAFSPAGWEWLAAVGAAVALMLLFSVFSAWYPAWRASRVQPVEALRANQ